MRKSELRELIKEVLEEELGKVDSQLTEATTKKTITKNEIRSINVPANKFAVMADPDDDASFCSYDPHYDEVWFENFFDELSEDNIFSTFSGAADLALLCAKKEHDLDFYIVSFDEDDYQSEAHITRKINGYNFFSRYDSASNTWSDRLKIRG